MSDATRSGEADEDTDARLERLENWCFELEEKYLAQRKRIDDLTLTMRVGASIYLASLPLYPLRHPGCPPAGEEADQVGRQ